MEDLDAIVYKIYALEAVFVEIIIPNKKNIVLGCIYRHPSMQITDLNQNYLGALMDKWSENKHAFLLGDFNIDLMKNDIDEHTATFHPTRTLIDNIFSNTPIFS